jgi:hypothetical protein
MNGYLPFDRNPDCSRKGRGLDMFTRGFRVLAIMSAFTLVIGSERVFGEEPSASAENPIRFTLGAELGLSFLNPTEGGDGQTVLSWPNNVLSYLPGFRLGILAGQSMKHHVYLNTGFINISDGGSFHVLSLTGNYQYAFPTKGTTSPYLTAGLGLVNVGGDGEGATSPMYGGGVGARFEVAEGHGALHLEARFDHVGEGDTIIDPADIISIQFGFDLWVQ